MGKIKAGQSVPFLEGKTLSGKVINTKEYLGSPLILSFYRYAACPFCNLRMHHFINKYKTEYKPAGIKVIGVFQSPVKSMKKYVDQHEAPFEIVSDPTYQWYKAMGVSTSWSGFAKGLANMKQATEASKLGLMRIDPEGPVNRIPADFLINPKGIVQVAYYGNAISDHISFDDITAWRKANKYRKSR